MVSYGSDVDSDEDLLDTEYHHAYTPPQQAAAIPIIEPPESPELPEEKMTAKKEMSTELYSWWDDELEDQKIK